MISGVIKPHISEERSRKPVYWSLGVHVGLLFFFTFGASLLPRGEVLKLGLGPGGGQGDFLSVGLAADIGGGAGMYKAPITPRPEAAPPQENVTRRRAVEPEPEPATPVFEEQNSKAPPKPTPQTTPTAPRLNRNEQAEEARPGQIPRQSEPGKGPSGGGGGSGGGFGGGQGVSIGSGTGEGNVNSWYIRQAEQRVGQNWLQTSLGDLASVEAIASFVVTSSGQITDIEIEKGSGIRSVDLAVMRAIQASNPFPPLPREFRGKSVRFQAVFEYPPR